MGSLLPMALGTLQAIRNPKMLQEEPPSDHESHVISLRHSRRLWRFAATYSLDRSFKVFEAINCLQRDFDYSPYLELNGLRPAVGHEGRCGNFLSHVALWRRLTESDKTAFLIFEDDTIFAPYAQSSLQKLMAQVRKRKSCDLVFLNGRTAQKLYLQCHFKDGEWKETPHQFLYKRSEMMEIMRRHWSRIPRNKNGVPTVFSGTDGYLITKNGACKLIRYIDEHGLGNVPIGGGHNVDQFLTAITTASSDHHPWPMAYAVQRYISQNVIREKPYLNAHVLAHPLSDVAQKAWPETASHIRRTKGKPPTRKR